MDKYFPDFIQDNDPAWLGEVYLEAAAILKDPTWEERVNWIAESCHTV